MICTELTNLNLLIKNTIDLENAYAIKMCGKTTSQSLQCTCTSIPSATWG